jgi:predicted PhzF superfamily epimerase YddE/YHI9
MKIPYYHIDAFASARFSGNPAGVCVLQEWLPDEVLQKIAFENNLSETAFVLAVERDGAVLVLDFPARQTEPCDTPEALVQGLGKTPLEVRRAKSYMAIFASPEDIASIKPDMQWLGQLDCSGIIVTAPGDQVDFVSRFFAPRLGIPEDPVTGSSHCSLIPYWAERLSKKKLTARQLSARGGELFCEHAGERVKIGGRAATYLSGEIEI